MKLSKRLMILRHFGISLVVLFGTTLTAKAAPVLHPSEAIVCATAEQCVDILDRHSPNAFDYQVLADEFVRLGPDSATALTGLAQNGEADHLMTLAPLLRPALALDIFAQLAANQKTQGPAAAFLAQIDLNDVAPGQLPTFDPDILASLMTLQPSEPLLRLTLQHPPQTTQTALKAALASRNTQIIGEAYEALFSLSPDMALRALMDQAQQTKDTDHGIALADMLGRRARRTGNRFYAETLDQMAIDPALPNAMQDAARLVSLEIGGRDVPLTLDNRFMDQMIRLFDMAPDRAVLKDHLTRHGRKLLPAWAHLAEQKSEARKAVLQAMQDVNLNDRYRQSVLRSTLSRPYTSRSVLTALRVMHLEEIDLFQAELRALAENHPWDAARFYADKSLRGAPVNMQATALVTGAEDGGLRASRSQALYCSRGQSIDFKANNSQVPPIDAMPGLMPRSLRARLGLPILSSSFPTASRWLFGFDAKKWGGALMAKDYRTGEQIVLLDQNVQLITPTIPVPLARQPETLFIFTGFSHSPFRNGAVWEMPPDGTMNPQKVRDLPDAVQRVFRLGNNSLLLHFHNADAPPATWTNHHPPLVLSPDGSLSRGCLQETLAGGAPPAAPMPMPISGAQ